MPRKPARRSVHIRADVRSGVAPDLLRRWVHRASRMLRLPPGEITVAFVDEATSRRLNARYRRKRRPTNVLSFTYVSTRAALTGDLILCPAVIKREAKEQGRAYRGYVRFLVEHGMIHLAGYDHGTDADQRAWEKLEQRLMQ